MSRVPLLHALALAGLGCATSATPPLPSPSPPSPSSSSSATAGKPIPKPGNEKLPPEEIQRVIQEHFARFRDCYEKGLRKQPGLAGRVAVSFVIELDGKTSQVEDKGSDLPNKDVVRCVVSAFVDLKFPSPKGGTVKFTYPIVFAPAGEEPTTPAPPGYFAGCFVRESPDGDAGKVGIECDQKALTVVNLAAKLGEAMVKREQATFEAQYPASSRKTHTTPTLNGSGCFQTTVDVARGPASMVLAPVGPYETRRVICVERGIPGGSSPWCARAIEILAQGGAVRDLLRTP